MHEPKGRVVPISGPRRFIIDLLHFAQRIPSVPVNRVMDVSPLFGPRVAHPMRPSWAVLFMKAYALVAAEHAPLRRALLNFPWPRLYEHPFTTCALAMEREYEGEEGGRDAGAHQTCSGFWRARLQRATRRPRVAGEYERARQVASRPGTLFRPRCSLFPGP